MVRQHESCSVRCRTKQMCEIASQSSLALRAVCWIKRACQGRHKKGRLGKVARSPQPEECPLAARAVAVGRMPWTCSLKCRGSRCHLRPTHADRGELSRSEE